MVNQRVNVLLISLARLVKVHDRYYYIVCKAVNVIINFQIVLKTVVVMGIVLLMKMVYQTVNVIPTSSHQIATVSVEYAMYNHIYPQKSMCSECVDGWTGDSCDVPGW